MNKSIMAFIDTYEEINVIFSKKAKYIAKNFYLYTGEDLIEKPMINYVSNETHITKVSLRVKNRLNLHLNYYLLDDMDNMIPVYTGSVVRTVEFESNYFYKGKLGFIYSKDSTIFRIWSPVASSIYVELVYPTGKKSKRELTYYQKGVWEVEIPGDLDGVAYIYYAKVFDKYKRVNDPYAISSSANGKYNYVIDVNKLYKMKYDKPRFTGNYCDAVIYEANIRDLTHRIEGKRKDSFMGVVDGGHLDYIKELGVTHLQLMPVYDFGGVDDIEKDAEYNWGYNPEQYFVPNGWYSINPDDPYSRINELLELIDECHKRGLRVVMDVVFNHVYEKAKFPFEVLVPGYFYRVDGFGNYTSVSGCGNDIATEKRMCSKFIIDNLKFWAELYNMSGFRFDLMGLLDIETLNNAYVELKEIDSNMMVYGEGWNMPNTIPDAFRPHSYNHFKMPKYAFFNDKYRDLVKGSQWEKSPGIAFGLSDRIYDLFHIITGSCLDHYRFDNPSQSINYAECHDNYTVYDFGKYELHMNEEDIIDGCRLALQIVSISYGAVFIHSGQEFYRTKQAAENSYNAGDDINIYDENRKQRYMTDIKGLASLLKLRKKYPEFRIDNPIIIEKRVELMNNLCTSNTLVYTITGVSNKFSIVVKNNRETYKFNCPGNMIFNGYQHCNMIGPDYTLSNIGVYIFTEELK